MVEFGSKDLDLMKKLTPAVTSFSRATGVAFDLSGEMAIRLADAYGFTEDRVAAVFDNIRQFAKVTYASAEDLTNLMKEGLESRVPTLVGKSQEAQQKILTSFSAMSAALIDSWGDDSATISKLLA